MGEKETFSSLSSSRQILGPSSSSPNNAINENYTESLLLRLENSEKECNRLRQSLEYSERINFQLQAENEQLLSLNNNGVTIKNLRNKTPPPHVSASILSTKTTPEGHTIFNTNTNININMKQQLIQHHKVEIEHIGSEVQQLLLSEKGGSSNSISSNDVIEKLKTQVTFLQESNEILIDMKDRLSTLIDDLIDSSKNNNKAKNDKSSSSIPHDRANLRRTIGGLEEIRNKLDMIDLRNQHQAEEEEEIEQCDLIAEATKKKKKKMGGLLGNLPKMMIEPLFARSEEDYGYKIEKPPDEDLNTANNPNDGTTNPRMNDSEIMGEDIYVPDPSSGPQTSNGGDDLPWWDVVSLEFDNDVKDHIEDEHGNTAGVDDDNISNNCSNKHNDTKKMSSFFGDIFGG